jgi:hypothetical protein
MRFIAKLAGAAVALAALTTSASAAVSLVNSTAFDSAPAVGESMAWNFDGIQDTTHFTFLGTTFAAPGVPGLAAEPAGDNSTFAAAEPGVNALFSTNPGFQLSTLSFYLGSLDDFNTLSFLHNGTLVTQFTGTQLTVPHPANGDQADGFTNRRYFFSMDAADGVNQVVFSSGGAAFEFDNIAAAISLVPEPETWAMMILGFGMIGFMLRNGRRKSALVA